MKNATMVLTTTLLGLALAGCAKNSPEPPMPDEPVTIVIENQNFYDATVYLRWSTDRRRLGTVTGFTTKEFDTRWIGPEVQVEVDLLAGGTYRGDRISVMPGESVEVQIPPALDRYPSGRGRIGN